MALKIDGYSEMGAHVCSEIGNFVSLILKFVNLKYILPWQFFLRVNINPDFSCQNVILTKLEHDEAYSQGTEGVHTWMGGG